MNRWTIGGFAALIVAIAGFYGATSALGFRIDRPAWRSEMIQLAALSLPDTRAQAQNDLLQIEAIIKNYQDQHRPIPAFLLKQQKELRDKIRAIDELLRK